MFVAVSCVIIVTWKQHKRSSTGELLSGTSLTIKKCLESKLQSCICILKSPTLLAHTTIVVDKDAHTGSKYGKYQ